MSEANDLKPNQLIHEKSPYLLQHAYNPVNWYPWDAESFEKAEREGKPIFLSIGYSTCHWCHVMAHESFEDEEVAAFLNEHFVSIKVDREERPDIDHIYMTVCQAMTGQGGWPLTVIMTPDKRPFFAGTYFPKTRRYGRMGLLEILQQVKQKWADDQDKIVASSLRIMEQLKPAMEKSSKGNVRTEWLTEAFEGFRGAFDNTYGGFGSAPKFPTPHNLLYLLRYGYLQSEPQAIEMVEKTLDAMYRGGIYDHVGYGFARYSTDREWLVPHFEKMLYDNALLLMAYTEAFQVTENSTYEQAVRDIASYIVREMRDSGGAFYSAQDADSEGVEGKFYVWTREEVLSVLGDELGGKYCEFYDITGQGNFEGKNIPNFIHQSLDGFCTAHNLNVDSWLKQVRRANEILYHHRAKRVPPHKDDKILTSWNGLMIAALAKVGRALDDSQYIALAEAAYEFLKEHLTMDAGRLLARYRDGQAAHLGYVDDYAFLIYGCLELYEATFKPDYLDRAVRLQDDMMKLFWDDEDGGFFMYGSDAEALIARPKEIYDGATPSGNSVAAMNLLRLGRMTGRTEYEQYSEQLMSAFAEQIGHYPMGHTQLLMALQYATGATREVVIAEGDDYAQVQSEIRQLLQTYLPDAVLLQRPLDHTVSSMAEQLSPFIREQTPLNGHTAIYICENYACQRPVTDVSQAMVQLLARQ